MSCNKIKDKIRNDVLAKKSWGGIYYGKYGIVFALGGFGMCSGEDL